MQKRRIISVIVIIIGLLVGVTIYYNHNRPDSVTTTATKSSSNQAQAAPQPNTSSNTATTNFDKTQFSTTDPSSIWVIVNKQHPLSPKDYAPTDLVTVGNGQYMRSTAAEALAAMFAAAKTDGINLTAASAYRSYDTQVTVYNNEVKNNGQAVADSQSARPGYSEHQTGLAVDIAGGGCSIEDCFGMTKEGKWAAKNAYKYGYLLRYTPDETTITGYRAEAWHFRYIGTALATELRSKSTATLEQFFGVSGGDY